MGSLEDEQAITSPPTQTVGKSTGKSSDSACSGASVDLNRSIVGKANGRGKNNFIGKGSNRSEGVRHCIGPSWVSTTAKGKSKSGGRARLLPRPPQPPHVNYNSVDMNHGSAPVSSVGTSVDGSSSTTGFGRRSSGDSASSSADHARAASNFTDGRGRRVNSLAVRCRETSVARSASRDRSARTSRDSAHIEVSWLYFHY